MQLLLLMSAFAAPERCDGVDDDGDGLIDNGPVWAAADADGDGFGDAETAVLLADCAQLGPNDVSDASDHDDTDSRRFPGAPEACNGLDDDGDGLADEDGCTCESHLVGSDLYLICLTPETWYGADAACASGGYHLATLQSSSTQANFDAVALDYGVDLWIGLTDAAVEGTFEWVSGASLTFTNWRYGEPNDFMTGEDCVEIEATTGLWDDQDCTYLEAFACERDCTEELWFADEDGDGLGDPDTALLSCAAPAGHVRNAADCDDQEERLPRAGFIDVDGDGYGTGAAFVACDAALVLTDGDCDDSNDQVHPGMVDAPDDGIDADCDGVDPTEPVDTGTPPVDTGTPPVDTGTPPVDTGTPPVDTGTPPVDTGTPPVDTGTPPVDTGTAVVDTAAEPEDTGTGTPGTGTTPTDPTGTGTTDTTGDGPPGADGGRATTDADGVVDYGFGLGCASVQTGTIGWAALLLAVARRRS